MKKLSLISSMILIVACTSRINDTVNNFDNEVIVEKFGLNKKNDSIGGNMIEECDCFHIVFAEGFENDSIVAYINEDLKFSDVVTTNLSLAITLKGFRFVYGDNDSPVLLRVKDEKSGFKILLDKNYRQLFIYKIDEKWKIIYDNTKHYYK